MDKETKSVQGTEGRSIRNKLEFSGRTVVSGMKKTGFRDGMWEGGSIPKTGFSERRKLSSTRKKNQFRTEGGSIGEIPEEKLEFRGRKVVSGMKKTEFRDRRGVRSGIFPKT